MFITMNVVLSSPHDLFKILVTSNLDWCNPTTSTIWKSREHYLEGLQYFIKEIGLKHETFAWYCYVAIIHAVIFDSVKGTNVNHLVVEMVTMIEAYPQHFQEEFPLLGELILMLFEKEKLDKNDIFISFPLQDQMTFQHWFCLGLDRDVVMRMLEFFLQVSSFFVKKTHLSMHFKEFISNFVKELYNVLGFLDISSTSMMAYLDMVIHASATTDRLDMSAICDGVLKWIEHHSFSFDASVSADPPIFDKVWSGIHIIVLEIASSAHGRHFASRIEQRLIGIIDHCCSKINHTDNCKVEQKLQSILAGIMSVLSVMVSPYVTSMLELSQIKEWCTQSTSLIWSLRIFANYFQKQINAQFRREIYQHLGIDLKDGLGAGGYSDCLMDGPFTKRAKISRSSFSAQNSSINAKDIVSLWNVSPADSLGTVEYTKRVSMCLVACAMLGISPKLILLPQPDGANICLADAYISTLLIVSDRGLLTEISRQWICELNELFTSYHCHLQHSRVDDILRKTVFVQHAAAFDPEPTLSSWYQYKKLVDHYSVVGFFSVHQYYASLRTQGTENSSAFQYPHDQASKLLDNLCTTGQHESAQYLINYSKHFFSNNDRCAVIPFLAKLNNYLEIQLSKDRDAALNILSFNSKIIMREVMCENSMILLDDAFSSMLAIMLSKKAEKPVMAYDASFNDHFSNSQWLWQMIEELLRAMINLIGEKDDCSDSESQSLVVDHSDKTSFVLMALNVITNYVLLVELIRGNHGMRNEDRKVRLGLLQEAVLLLVESPSKQINLLSAVARLTSAVMVQTIWSRPQSVTKSMAEALQILNELQFIRTLMSKLTSLGGLDVNAILLIKSLSLTGAVCCLIDSPATIWATTEICKVFTASYRRTPLMVAQNVVEQFSRLLRFSQVFKAFPTQIMESIIFPVVSQQQTNIKSCLVVADKLLRVGSAPFMLHFPGITLAQLVIQPKVGIKAILNVVTSSKIDFPLPKEYLLEEWPDVLYHLLLSDAIFEAEFADVVKQKLFGILQQSCRVFSVKLQLPGREDILSEKAWNQLIIQLVWSLGSHGEISRRAAKGLQIICFLYFHRSWSVDIGDCDDESLTKNQNWSAQKCTYQIKSLISLRNLIFMLEGEAIAKFFPKSNVTQVKLNSIEVAAMLWDRLPEASLTDNLIVMVAGLCSMFIERVQQKADNSHVSTSTAERLTHALPTPMENICSGVYLMEFVESASYLERQEEAFKVAKQKCISLISKLLFSNSKLITKAVSFMVVGGVPNDPQLEAVKAQHQTIVSNLTLDETIFELHDLLKHESVQVRTIALKLCLHILERKKESLYGLLDISMNNATVGLMDSSIALLVKDLLELTTRETDPTILEHAARCLGEMGSISPSLIKVVAFETNKKFSTKDFRNPLSLTLLDFSLHILEVYIVMGFKGANSVVAQDQSSHAIQEILQILKNNQTITNSQHIPEDLRKELSTRGILDIVEPFWASKYKIKEFLARYKTPLYRTGMEYGRWVYLLCRYLIPEAKGPLKAIFDACRGVVRHRLDLCQFLLPYLILDISMHRTQLEDVYQAVIDEFALVLSFSKVKGDRIGEVDNFNQLCVQTIFNVLDIFEDWKATLLDPDCQLPTSSGVFGTKKDVIAAVQKVVEKISLHQLSEAAMVTKSFTRAMRYIEMESRERHRLQRTQIPNDQIPASSVRSGPTSSMFSITSILKRRDDKAGGELPILTEGQINSLGTVFGELEDIDALSGIQIMRRVHGYSESLKHKIMELTQSDDWLGALLEYELIQNSPIYLKTLHNVFTLSTQPSSGGKIFSGTPNHARNNMVPFGRLIQRNKDSLYHNPYRPEDYTVGIRQASDSSFSVQDICDIEKGKLRCLMELGHLESVIQQSSGRSALSEDLKRTLTPIGLEASWRLMKWDDANCFVDVANANQNDFYNMTEAEDFRLRLGKSFVFMKKGDCKSFEDEISEARRNTVLRLAAAGMESYDRAYPALFRLHMLQEVEKGFELLSLSSKRKADYESSHQNILSPVEMIDNLQWDNRLKFMSDSMAHRSQLLAIRRTIFGLLHLDDKVAQNWMGLSNELRHMGRYDSARIALRNAVSCGIDEDVALLEDCRLLREQGQSQKALLILEPSEIDLVAIHNGTRAKKKNMPSFLDSDEKRKTLAERIHLATQIIVELQQSQPAHIIDRYETILQLNKNWDQAFYDCGKYFEFLFADALEKDLVLQQSIGGSSSAASSNSSRSNHSTLPHKDSRNYYHYVESAIEKYGQCLKLKGETIFQVLPKILTLWFSYTELGSNGGAASGSGNSAVTSPLQSSQAKVNYHMQKLAQEVGPNIWFHALQQIVSRVGHKNPETVEIIEKLLLEVMKAYPKQGIWHIAHLMYSLNKDRREIAKKVLRETHRVIKGHDPNSGKMLVESQHLFQNLSNLAALNCNQRRITWQMDKKIQLDLFLVPTQSILLHCESDNGFMHIQKFGEFIDVASSKAKPKTIRFETTCGKSLKFLCKQEKDGDLRKDVRMMEFNNTVNKLFQHDSHGGRQRNLRLRTYAVVCLNEECGILEWVNNTECLRHLITQAHTSSHLPNWSDLYPMLYVKDIYLTMKDYQEKYEDDLLMMIKSYQDIVGKYKPCFHRWFLERFKDATAWYEARQLYTRSVAVWSGVGHVIGLGDRHTENILLDITNGECVQVDFDCLFDKGLTLLRPEIIPFRLTQNMVDAMGVCGVEGTFRRTLELTLKVLRENKEILLNVLEPFLRDPTVAWSRAGRAQKNDQNTHSKQQLANEDQVNNEATDMMKRIAARLSGEYYFLHPGRDKLIRGAKTRNQPIPSKGVGPAKEELMPLSVAGQAQKLLDEATAIENLAQLYYGWQAWL